MRDLKAVGAERGSRGGCSVLPAGLGPLARAGPRSGGGREAGGVRQPRGGGRGSGAAGTFRPGAAASASSGANFAKPPPGRTPLPPALLRSGARGGGPGPRRLASDPPGALRHPSAAAEPNGRAGLRRAPPHLGGHGGRFPGPGGPAGLRRRGASALAGGGRTASAVSGGCGPARRGTARLCAEAPSSPPLLSALGPPRLGDSRRRPRLQFLKVPGCAAPAPAGQASHGPRRARRGRRKRAWGLGRSPASSPAPASAPTPPPAALGYGRPRLERRLRGSGEPAGGRASAGVAAWSASSRSRGPADCVREEDGDGSALTRATRLGSPAHGGAAEGSGCLGGSLPPVLRRQGSPGRAMTSCSRAGRACVLHGVSPRLGSGLGFWAWMLGGLHSEMTPFCPSDLFFFKMPQRFEGTTGFHQWKEKSKL